MDRKIITIGSPDSGEKKFKVEIGNGGLQSQPFCVYAWHEQDALDAAVDYCEQAGWDGLFWDDDESVEEYPDDFVTAGNHSHLLRSDCFHVTQLNESKNMSKKNTIRLTESDLKRVISESVKRVLKEMDESYVINKLLSQTSDYLMKFDASDEARTCAQALENWTEYRASYILDCLNFACKHAYKCLNSDIDENPNAYLQVAFEARKMWREYMM